MASGAELELHASHDSKITNVTVYPDGADVTRTFQVALKDGSTDVKIHGGLIYASKAP
jgi:hypothetical protein